MRNLYSLMAFLLTAALIIAVVSASPGSAGTSEKAPGASASVSGTGNRQGANGGTSAPVARSAESGEELNWDVLSGGGNMGGLSISYGLSGTAGQTAVASGSAGGKTLTHGFWQVFASGTCCIPPTVGDVDQSGGVDITDVQLLVDNQFLTLTPLICKDEGNINYPGSGYGVTDTLVDISDLQLLIDNQFLTLTPLPPCP
jgi:hypothetical protein